MSKAATAGIIAIAAAVFLGGASLGSRFGYSQFAAVSFGLLPALLVAFPIVRERSGGKMTFAQWCGVLFISLLFAMVINNLLAATMVAPNG